MQPGQGRLTTWLEKAPKPVFTAFAMLAGFSTYFCMYAYRKPIAAATFKDLRFLESKLELDLKTAFVISQVVGYALSKYIGIKVVSEAPRHRRAAMLILMIVAAELALLAFAVLPANWKVLAIFFNGLSLGMVWGLVVWYLEGRRTSELLLAALCCSFIVSTGIVKDVGMALMAKPFLVTEEWMPVTTGLVFLPIFLLSVWLLQQLPVPDQADIAARVARIPMDGAQRLLFIKQFFVGLALLIFVYFFLTAYRDCRDNFGVEILTDVGLKDRPGIFSQTETIVLCGVIPAMATLSWIKDNRKGLLGAFVLMMGGLALMGAGTLLFDYQAISAFVWIVCTGLGCYLAYVPINSMLFDRLIATTRFTGTAVFAIYLADSAGYTGSVGIVLYKAQAHSNISWLAFFRGFSYLLSVGGTVALLSSCWFFLKRRTEFIGDEPRDPLKKLGECQAAAVVDSGTETRS
jgi:hypothetical protein